MKIIKFICIFLILFVQIIIAGELNKEFNINGTVIYNEVEGPDFLIKSEDGEIFSPLNSNKFPLLTENLKAKFF